MLQCKEYGPCLAEEIPKVAFALARSKFSDNKDSHRPNKNAIKVYEIAKAIVRHIECIPDSKMDTKALYYTSFFPVKLFFAEHVPKPNFNKKKQGITFRNIIYNAFRTTMIIRWYSRCKYFASCKQKHEEELCRVRFANAAPNNSS